MDQILQFGKGPKTPFSENAKKMYQIMQFEMALKHQFRKMQKNVPNNAI